jgi:hypothetical protein
MFQLKSQRRIIADGKKTKKTLRNAVYFLRNSSILQSFFFKRVGKSSFLKAKQKLHFNDS